MTSIDVRSISEISKVIGGEIRKTRSTLSVGEQHTLDEPMDGATDRNLDCLLNLLSRLGLGYVVFDNRNNLVDWNSVAMIMFGIQNDAKDLSNLVLAAFSHLTMSVHCKLAPNTLTWVVIAYRGGTPVVMHEKIDLVPPNRSVVLLLDRDTRPHPNPALLQHMFGLTNAETQLLISIACGYTLLEIARSRKLCRTTIRSHLASLFAKTETSRQSELIALIDSFAILR
jgi:DNA-binding CsgD family transcriptional regulator